MVEIIRKSALPTPSDVPSRLREATRLAHTIKLREPRPPGFPLLFTRDMQLIEPAVAYLHEHTIRRAHTADTLNTYTEILYDWFESLEQNNIDWREADAVDLISYRNRMLQEKSSHTGRPYSVRTINHRVRGVLRFYEWLVRAGWLTRSELAGRDSDFAIARSTHSRNRCRGSQGERGFFVLRQFETLPRPLSSTQLRELLATLPPPYDLMARWQLYTGLRVSEVLQLTLGHIVAKTAKERRSSATPTHQIVDITRKGRKRGYVIAPGSLLNETDWYVTVHRSAWIKRAVRAGRTADRGELFLNGRGTPVKKNSYQQVMADTGEACGFRATTHLLRASFACMMLARLEQLAKGGAAINPLLVVKVLLGHEHIDTTDKYLRAVAVDELALTGVLDSLLQGS